MDLDGWALFAPVVVAILAMVAVDLGVAFLMRATDEVDRVDPK